MSMQLQQRRTVCSGADFHWLHSCFLKLISMRPCAIVWLYFFYCNTLLQWTCDSLITKLLHTWYRRLFCLVSQLLNFVICFEDEGCADDFLFYVQELSEDHVGMRHWQWSWVLCLLNKLWSNRTCFFLGKSASESILHHHIWIMVWVWPLHDFEFWQWLPWTSTLLCLTVPCWMSI